VFFGFVVHFNTLFMNHMQCRKQIQQDKRITKNNNDFMKLAALNIRFANIR